MAEVLNFQDMIFTLQRFWAQQGCVIMQPYDMEVGAGTFHTATFLRAIGPEPWNPAYVQPSRRPTAYGPRWQGHECGMRACVIDGRASSG